MRKNGKKALSLLLALCMVLGMLPGAAFAAEGGFTIENGVLTKYTGTGGDVVIPEGVNSIGWGAFQYCTSLTSVTIPDSVKTIEGYAFAECSGLTGVTIPESVESIGEGAFSDCTGLKSVTIPSSVQSLGGEEGGVFFGCTSLTSVTIPEGIISIGKAMFADCSSLESVTIPNSATTIGNTAFLRCSSLTSVTIPAGVTTIEEGAFFGCTGLKSVIIPEGVTRIEEQTFYECKALTSVTIPSSIEFIDPTTFVDCGALTHIYYAESADKWAEIYSGGENDPLTGVEICCNAKDSTFQVSFDANGGTLDASDSLAVTVGQAYGALPVPTSGGYTFVGWYTEKEDGNRVTDETIVDLTAGQTLYAHWTAGQYTVTFDANGGTLDASESSMAVTVGQPYGALPEPILSGYIFDGWYTEKEGGGQVIAEHVVNLTRNQTLYAHWTAGMGSGTCGDNVTWTLQDGVLTISGTGEMDAFDYQEAPWYSEREAITSIEIGSGVTGIGTYAFLDCTALKSVTIPSGVTDIGLRAFQGCTGLESVAIGSGVTSIGGYAFSGCTNLKSVDVSPSSAGNISFEGGAFRGCTGLESVTVGRGVGSIGESAFEGCTSLKNVFISRSIGSVGDRAFLGCTSLSGVEIPDNTAQIGHFAFSDCTSLKSVTLRYAANVGRGAFEGCTGLESVTIRSAVKYISPNAFDGCTGITDVYYGGSEVQWNKILSNATYPGAALHYNTLKGTCGEDLTWILKNGTLTISGTGAMTDYSNRWVPWYADDEASRTNFIVIGDGVTSIGGAAFSGCTWLTTVIIPASVTSIEDAAFKDCTALTDVYYGGSEEQWHEILSPDGNEVLTTADIRYNTTKPEGGSCGDNGDNATWSLLGGVLTISGTGAMKNYDSSGSVPWHSTRGAIDSVVIDDGVTSVGARAFSGITNLGSVTIGGSVTSIEALSFEGCTGLEGVTIPDSISSIGLSAFENCTGLTSLTIPNSIISIGRSAFQGCTSLSSLTIPDSVTEIGWYAFSGCTGLTSLTISGNISRIGDCAFSDCTALTDLTIGSGVESIGEHMFSGCKGLKSVDIPDSVTSIEDGAFHRCTGLESVTIPDSVTSLGRHAFSYCTSLTSVTIGRGVTDIAYCAFSCCTGLKNVTIPGTVTEIGQAAFSNCTGLIGIAIPDSVTHIGHSAFSDCTALKSVTIPASVTRIGDRAFENCTGLTGVTIPNTVTDWLGEYVFAGCRGLTSAAIENGFESVAGGTFSQCTNLSNVDIPSSVTSIGNHAFEDCSGLTSVDIPEGVTTIAEYAFSGCSGLTGVTIPPNVTSIRDGAFKGCTGLTSITIPMGVTSIEAHAFEDCTGLQSVTIPESVTSIRYSAFDGCTSLTSVDIPEGVTTIGEHAFSGCSGLTSVDIPAGVIVIEDYVFSSCKGLTNVVIPESIATISHGAFYNCSGLTSVVIPVSVTTIGGSAFSGCTGLTSVTIPASVTTIDDCMFLDCTSLTSVVIPVSVTEIGERAFSGCNELRDVYYAGTEAQWSQISIDSGNEDLTDAAIHYNDQSHASYMVTFHANGGTVSLPGMTVVSAQPYGALPTPVRKGHTFVGWFTQAAGGSQVTAETTVDLTENQTLYAHWTQDKRPTFEALTYGDIDNSRAAFGYPDGYRIPLERYISVFGDNVMARRAYELAGEWNGSCYGMSATSALFFQGDGGITPDSFRSGAANPAALELTDKSEALDLTLLAFIEQLQVSQYASVIQAYSNSTRNDYSGLAAAVRAFQETGEDPVVIVDATHAHTLVGYELQEAGGETRLMVYDCSAPAEAKYLVLSKNEAENYTSCFYGGGNIEVYYIPYAAFYQVWSDHTGTVEVPMDLLDINVPNAEIYDADGTLAAEIKDGALETQRTDIYELTQAGAAGSSRTGSAIWVPAGRQYVVKNTDTAVKTLEVTMVSMEQSVSVTTGGSQVVLAVDDAKASNFVKVENPEAPGTDAGYTVTMESTLTQQPTVVTVSGNLGTSAAPEVRQEGGTLSVTNAGSIGQGTTVKVNEQEITQAELKDGSTLDLDQLMRSPITATLQTNGTVELSRAPYGVRYVFAASYEAGRMTGMVQGTLQGKTVTFQGPVNKGFQLFFLDGSYAPLCDKVAVG